jgi:hypothetical protein
MGIAFIRIVLELVVVILAATQFVIPLLSGKPVLPLLRRQRRMRRQLEELRKKQEEQELQHEVERLRLEILHREIERLEEQGDDHDRAGHKIHTKE